MSKYEALYHEQFEDIKLIFDKVAIFVGLNIKFISIFILSILVILVILAAKPNSSKGILNIVWKNSILSDIIKDTQANILVRLERLEVFNVFSLHFYCQHLSLQYIFIISMLNIQLLIFRVIQVMGQFF